MHNFTLQTSMPFPFFELKNEVEFTEVKKPSGVAYMLLVLFNESKSKSYKISKLLNSFDIPSNFYEIFAQEIDTLIEHNIIKCKTSYNRLDFEDYKLSDFAFTEKGKKVFADEQISTGNIKSKDISCFYNIAFDKLFMKNQIDIEIKSLKDGAFDENFMNQFDCKRNVEDFYNLQKGPNFPVKQSEIITKIEPIGRNSYVGMYPCRLIVEEDDIKIKFEYDALQGFYEKYYNSNIINKAISMKTKFKLENGKELPLSGVQFSVDSVKYPEELKSICEKKYQLILARKGYVVNKSPVAIDYEKSIDEISNLADIVTIDNFQINAYCPVKLLLKEKRFGKVVLPVVLVHKVSIDDFFFFFDLYIDTKNQYSEENIKEILQICNITKNYAKAVDMLKLYMTENIGENINILREVKQLFSNNTMLSTEYKKLLETNYFNCLHNVSEDSLDTVLKITFWIPSFMHCETNEVLSKLINGIGNIKDKVYVFEVLSKQFKPEIILNYVNPFEDILNGKTSSVKLLQDVSQFNRVFVELKNVAGINDSTNCLVDEENIEKINFQNVFKNVVSLQKNILIFKPYNKEYFDNVDKYMYVFGQINDYFNKLDAALKNPKKITSDLIEKKIVSGDYQFVLINLSAKLEWLLFDKFKLQGDLFEKLNQAKDNNLLDKKIIIDLHKLRQARNPLVHAEKQEVDFDADDLRRWNKEVFAIEEEKK